MKATYFIGTALCALLLIHCKTNKQTTTTAATPAPTPPPTVVVATPGSDNAIPTQLQVAGKRWPGTEEAELEAGKLTYTTKCTRCHKAYRIEEFGEKKWLHEIDDMSPKARLTPEEKTKLTKYILSYRELKETVNKN